MTRTLHLLGLFFATIVLPPALCSAGDYAITKTLKLGGEGGWDYVTIDPANKLLYLPRPTHTMVVSTDDGKLLADIPGTKRSHGVALAPEVGRGFITDGEEGSVLIFDLKTRAVLGKVAAADDADGIIADPASGTLLVACGDAGVLVPIKPDVDPKAGKPLPAVKLEGKPEFLAADGKGRAYVNLVDKATVAVVDTREMKVVSRWSTGDAVQPSALAIDPAGGRLFIGCRSQRLIVMSTRDGKILGDVPIGRGVDACAFDPGTGDVFASCGDGTLYIIREKSPGTYAVAQKLTTKPGSRTMGLDPTTHVAYLPTAEAQPGTSGRRTVYKPDTFGVLVVAPAKP